MEKFIPYEKLSKKEKRKVDAAQRSIWGDLNPITRKPQNSKAYNRNKARSWKREMHETNSGIFFATLGSLFRYFNPVLRPGKQSLGHFIPHKYENFQQNCLTLP